MIDRIAGSAPGNGSRAAVGEDLVAMTKCRLQARNFMSQDGGATAKKMKRHTSAMPLNNVSSPGSVNDSSKLHGFESSELESTATSRIKRLKPEVNHALLEQIQEINQKLIDTVVDVSDDDADSVAAASKGGEGTVVKCSYTAVALSPELKAQFASTQMSLITPLRLLVPANYPKCSPVLLDNLPIEPSKEFEDLSTKAKFKVQYLSPLPFAANVPGRDGKNMGRLCPESHFGICPADGRRQLHLHIWLLGKLRGCLIDRLQVSISLHVRLHIRLRQVAVTFVNSEVQYMLQVYTATASNLFLMVTCYVESYFSE